MSLTRTTIGLVHVQSKHSYCVGAMGRCRLPEGRRGSRLLSSLCSFEESEWRTRQSSPSTSECDDDLYRNFFIPFSAHLRHISLFFPQWNKSATNSFFWPRSRRAVFQVSGHQKITCISVTLHQLHYHKQCLLYEISVEFHNIRFLPSFVQSKSFIWKVLSIPSN